MWIFLNDAMFSIVQDRNNEDQFVVRSRGEGDIEKVFDVDAIFMSGSDYAFRAYINKEDVKAVITGEFDYIDYDNFKNSMDPEDKERKIAYMRVWQAMFDYQEKTLSKSQKYGWDYGNDPWWLERYK